MPEGINDNHRWASQGIVTPSNLSHHRYWRATKTPIRWGIAIGPYTSTAHPPRRLAVTIAFACGSGQAGGLAENVGQIYLAEMQRLDFGVRIGLHLAPGGDDRLGPVPIAVANRRRQCRLQTGDQDHRVAMREISQRHCGQDHRAPKWRDVRGKDVRPQRQHRGVETRHPVPSVAICRVTTGYIIF